MELLPTILELQQEYEGLGVEFLYLSLDIDGQAEAQALMRKANGPSFYRMAISLEEATAALGISEPPALICYRPGAVPSVIEGNSLSPENAVAFVEALVTDHL